MNDRPPPTAHWLAEPHDDAPPTLWLERAAHLVRHHASDPFRRGCWEGTYRVEQQRLARATGKLYDASPTDDVPAEVVPIWEEEFALRSERVRLANKPKALAAAESVTPTMREFDPEVFGRMPTPEDVKAEACEERRRCHRRHRRISRLRTRSSHGQHRRAPSARSAAAGARDRTSSSSRSSGSDPGDGAGDPDPPGVATPPAEGGKTERVCLAVDCEQSITEKATQARFCTNRCRVRDERARQRRERLVGTVSEQVGSADSRGTGCGCSSAAAPDPDGQPICIACGRPKGDSPPVNGFDRRAVEMERDRGTFHLLDGQREAGHRSVAVYR